MSEIKSIIMLLANEINVPKNLIPEINVSNDFAKPFIDTDREEKFFYYVIRERGVEHKRDFYGDVQELLYRVFKDITFVMAADFELRNRIENQDFRILLFKKQEELLLKLNCDWAKNIYLENKKYLEI
nr:Imm63 family immunity protein [uncultured Chryseobacterium sp.]